MLVLKSGQIYHCPNKKALEEFTKAAKKQGIYWSSGQAFSEKLNKWEFYKSNTLYYIEGGTSLRMSYGDMRYASVLRDIITLPLSKERKYPEPHEIIDKTPEVGDIVMLKNTSGYYLPNAAKNSCNPINITGVITAVRDDAGFPYSVDWSNGTKNVYEVNHLIVVEEPYKSVYPTTPKEAYKTKPVLLPEDIPLKKLEI